MQKKLSLVALAFLVAGGTAQRRSVPANALTTEGNNSSYMPWIYDKGRSQHLIDGKSFVTAGGVIREFAYRRDGGISRAFAGRAIATLKVTIGYSMNSAANMSTTFASNRSGTQTVVMNGAYNLPPQPVVTGLGPWNVRFKPATPFVYTIANGNLLIEFEIPGQARQKNEYYLDAHGVGLPGTYTVFGTPGPFKSGDRHFLYSNPTNLKPGGSADIRATGLMSPYPALAVYGFSNTQYGPFKLPLDLTGAGAGGNHVYVSLDFLFPLTLTLQGSRYTGTFQLLLPNNPAIGGVTLYGTAIYFDPPSNRLQLVFSRGLAMTIGSTGKGPMQMLGSSDSSRPTGNFLNRSGTLAPVIELTGAFGFN